MRTHEVKIWPEFFDPIEQGDKPFEIRRDDRSYAVGDALCLREWDPTPTEIHGPRGYTGRVCTKVITYKFSGGRMGIPEGICVLGLSREVACS
jgi:hypothetical protein